MRHPEGRVLAIQQQMFMAELLAEKMDMDSETVLRKLAIAGLTLAIDVNEITVDAAAILPNLTNIKTRLRAVPKDGE